MGIAELSPYASYNCCVASLDAQSTQDIASIINHDFTEM